jgi:predicted RNase H-like HicB family nuclease
MKSYVFTVTLERDGDVWRAFVPALEEKGAATCGSTREDALRSLQEA